MKANHANTEWNKYHVRLSAFHEQHGHLQLPANDPDSRKLADWLARQKTQHSSLAPEQIRKLLELGVTFGKWDAHWYYTFFELADYVRTHDKFPERRTSLDRWAGMQREHHRKGRLAPHRRRLLDSIGIVWNFDRKSFAERLEDLKAFKAKHGHCRVPVDYEEIPGLGGYVATSLRFKRAHRTPEEIRQLDDLGFVWDPIEESWQQRFAEFKAFMERFGAYPTHGTNQSLASWVLGQRTKPQSEEHIRQLDAIGFEWETPTDERWIERYGELKAFVQKFGHCRVPQNKSAYRSLHTWLYAQRTYEKSLPPDRRKLLDDLGVNWTIRPLTSREDRLKELEDYYQTHGHCNVRGWENRSLSSYLSSLRLQRAQLPAAFRQKLEAMGMDWSLPTSLWNRRYADAAAVKAQYGLCDIPFCRVKNKTVAGWLYAERRRWERLTAEQQQLLIALDPSLRPPQRPIR